MQVMHLPVIGPGHFIKNTPQYVQSNHLLGGLSQDTLGPSHHTPYKTPPIFTWTASWVQAAVRCIRPNWTAL